MDQLFSMAVLLTMLSPQNHNLPPPFYQLPEPIKESATVIVSGTYGQGRTPCMFRPDGTRVWGLDSWINIKRVYRGKVGSKSININRGRVPTSEYVSKRLEQGHEYLLLLRPGEETLKKIKSREGTSFWDALHDEEILAIVESK
jgi:hypothetical protein